jgi:nucleoside-diphosphate kinase
MSEKKKVPSKEEKTMVIIKPDGVQRQIVGEILTRFEKKGFKIVAMKMIQPTSELVGQHYPYDKKEMETVGIKTIAFAKQLGEEFPETDPFKIGEDVRRRNMRFMAAGPVIAMILQGVHVVQEVRKFVGPGNPAAADVGTIRADFTPDSYNFGDIQQRAARNIIHASDSEENAKREIDLWFKPEEIVEYTTAIEKILYDPEWDK